MPAVFLPVLRGYRFGIGSVPVERVGGFGQAAVEMGIDDDPPVVGDMSVPILNALQERGTYQQTVAGDMAGEDLAFEGVLRIAPEGAVRAVLFVAVMVGAASCVLRADGLHLFLNLVGKPDVILVGDGGQFALYPGKGRDEVHVEPQVGRVAVETDVRIAGSIFPDDVRGPVCRSVILYDDGFNGVALAQDGIQLLTDIGGTVVGAHHHRNGGSVGRGLQHFVLFCLQK